MQYTSFSFSIQIISRFREIELLYFILLLFFFSFFGIFFFKRSNSSKYPAINWSSRFSIMLLGKIDVKLYPKSMFECNKYSNNGIDLYTCASASRFHFDVPDFEERFAREEGNGTTLVRPVKHYDSDIYSCKHAAARDPMPFAVSAVYLEAIRLAVRTWHVSLLHRQHTLCAPCVY